MIPKWPFLCLVMIFNINFNIAQSHFSLQIIRPKEFALKTADLWNCVITNTGPTAHLQLHGVLTEKTKGKLYEVQSGAFDLAKGVTQFNTQNYEALKGEKVLFKNPSFEEHVYRTNTFPNGDYTICIKLINIFGRTEAEECIQHVVNKVTPPSLIAPGHKTNICEEFPIFVWERYRGAINNSNIRYKIKLVEILKNQNEIQAIKANPCFYCESYISNPPLQYSFKNIKLQDDKSYAWYIGVLDGKKEITRSEVWSFVKMDCNQPIRGRVDTYTIGEDEEEEPEVEVVNKEVPGKSYYFIPNYSQQNDRVTVAGDELNFYIDNLNECQEMRYSVSKDLFKDTSIKVGRNYFTINSSDFNLQRGQPYTLRLLFDNGEQRLLYFKIL